MMKYGLKVMLHRKVESDLKVLAVDLGDARTGVAVSDLTGSIVGYTTVIHSWNREDRIET